MPITTIYPTSTGSSGTDMPANAGTCHESLADASDSTFLARQGYAGDSHAENGGTVGDLPASATTVASVQPVSRAQGQSGGGGVPANGGARLQGGVRVGGLNYDAFGQDMKDQDGIQNFIGTVYTINPNTAAPWTVADVNGMSWWAGANSYHNDGDVARVMQLSFIVDYGVAAPSTGRAIGAPIIVG